MLFEPLKKCFIIGNPRSGTTRLGDIISFHSQAKRFACEQILDLYQKNNNISKFEIKQETKKILIKNDVLKEIMTFEEKRTYVRFFLLSIPIAKVRIIRNNKLQQVVSHFLANQTKLWQTSHKVFGQEYLKILKNLKPIPLDKILVLINYFKKSDNILDEELKNKKYICLEYEKFYFKNLDYQKEKLSQIFTKMNIETEFNEKMINVLKKGKLNSLESYKMIPNIKQIDKELSNEENGFLFQQY